VPGDVRALIVGQGQTSGMWLKAWLLPLQK
ncbi:hypothetical protein DBR06_SOUSAS17010044, partial [Sousa chinensis]